MRHGRQRCARGGAAEIECEQYLTGYTDAYLRLAGTDDICLPDQNRADEVRWAFMKWATQHYDRRDEPAAEGVFETLHATFKCP